MYVLPSCTHVFKSKYFKTYHADMQRREHPLLPPGFKMYEITRFVVYALCRTRCVVIHSRVVIINYYKPAPFAGVPDAPMPCRYVLRAYIRAY
jgi:hypothetical protein